VPAKFSENRILQAVREPNSPLSASYRKTRVAAEEFTHRGAVVIYNVTVGSFVVKVTMLNVNAQLKDEAEDAVVNKGNFGSIVLGKGPTGEFVSKRINFIRNIRLSNKPEWIVRANFFDLESILTEFAIAKVCSMFGIAPKVLTPFGFDVICYRNCVEFFM